MLDIFTLL